MVTQNSVPGSSFGKGCAPATQSKLKLIRPGSGRAEPCRRISVLAGMPEQKNASLLSVGFTQTDGHTKVFQDPALRQVVPRLLKAGIDTDRVQAAGFVLILEKCLALIGRAKPPKIKNNLQTGSVANQENLWKHAGAKMCALFGGSGKARLSEVHWPRSRPPACARHCASKSHMSQRR